MEDVTKEKINKHRKNAAVDWDFLNMNVINLRLTISKPFKLRFS